jgi:hypothetical protein
MFYFPPNFASGSGGVTQYFSDRLYDTKAPFNAQNIDYLTVSISRSRTLAAGYVITIKSSTYGFTESFSPNFDPQTNVIYGTVGSGFVTVSLCSRLSQPPNPVH